MATYTISASGTEMGSYSGASESEAIEAYVRDAGYKSVEHAADTLGQTVAQFLADVSAVEV